MESKRRRLTIFCKGAQIIFVGIVKDKSCAVDMFVHDTDHSRITFIFTNKRVRYTCEHVYVGVSGCV